MDCTSTFGKSSIKPLSGIFISSAFEGRGGGLIEMVGLFEKGGSFNLEMMMQVSVLHRELEYKEEKLKYKKFLVMQPRIRIKSKLPVAK